MADSILTQTDDFKPSASIVQLAMELLRRERETMTALSIALFDRLKQQEDVRNETDRSTEAVLMELIVDQIGDMRQMDGVERLLTGVDR